MKCYKLTDKNCTTKNNTLFELGKPVRTDRTNKYLCSNGWIHFYQDPLIAILMNPIHADFDPCRLFEAKAAGEMLIKPLKAGCKELTLVKELKLPAITTANRIAFGIYCALEVYKNPKFVLWAHNWIFCIDRRCGAAANVAHAAINASAYAAANAAVRAAAARAAAANAARAAANAANAAADAATAARAARATRAAAAIAAAYAADAAADVAYAADAAAYAADAAADISRPNKINFVELAIRAMKVT